MRWLSTRCALEHNTRTNSLTLDLMWTTLTMRVRVHSVEHLWVLLLQEAEELEEQSVGEQAHAGRVERSLSSSPSSPDQSRAAVIRTLCPPLTSCSLHALRLASIPPH